MVDRRKLIAGGSAAAFAATLAAVAGGSAARAVSPRALQRITVAHAQAILDLVDPERGLVSPAGFLEVIQRGWKVYVTSDPGDPKADDLDAWVLRRMMDLCGSDSFADAGTKIVATRTLLAFCIVAYSQHQDPDLPKITRSMPVPDALLKLEPDFMPVLLGLINETAERSRPFAEALNAGTAELDRILDEQVRSWSGKDVTAQGRATAQMSDRDMVELTVGFLTIYFFFWCIRYGRKD